ncbi:MAG: ABC transporter ATP-binding protein [Rhodospirillales bacterium]|nr:ABC transporter ATP-binding protein [Rhodospirillales bacterium]
MSILKITGLQKSFGAITAIDGLDLTVEEGEFFALLGPSASGKTTSLRCIAGIEKPDAGQIEFEGSDVVPTPIQGRGMAMVFQAFALYPHLTTEQNLAYPLRERGIEQTEVVRRVAEIAEQLRLGHTLARKPDTLSGGEQQRVAIGRALIGRPKLLLLDEPLTNLDAKLRHDTRAEFKRLHRELGMTILYATPDELEALSMGQRIAILEQGRIRQVGTPDQLYDAPESDLVARRVGSPVINLIRGTAKANATINLPFADISGGNWARTIAGFDVNTEVLLGLRPSQLKLVEGTPGGPNFKATVELLEPLGDVTILDINAAGVEMQMVLPEAKAVGFKVGDSLEIEFDPTTSLLFAADTGTAIS